MNKENKEQPENIEDPKQQETPEVNASAEKTSNQAQPAQENPADSIFQSPNEPTQSSPMIVTP